MIKKSLIVLIFVIGVVILLFLFSNTKEDIGNVGELIERNESFNVYKSVFKGDDGKEIYALLFAPLKESFDVIVVLPAAGGTKESRRFYGEILAEIGYGAFILDQRGLGETNGNFPSFQEEFNSFLNGKSVFQFLMAKDAVSAINLLENFKGIERFGVLGESMGGRNAIIAAGLDNRIKTAIIISSAGYKGGLGSKEGDEFLAYINPDNYVGKISPRRLLMLHSINDSVIALSDARNTFILAGEPKKFVEFNERKYY